MKMIDVMVTIRNSGYNKKQCKEVVQMMLVVKMM